MRFAGFLSVLLGLGVCVTSSSAEDAYIDDRSTPETLVKSLYNAVNRKEYARAWSYFSAKPAANLEAYAEGYKDTASVEVLTGSPGEEGAAGSVFYALPVSIRATDAGGSEKVFAGCYTLRLANPQVQGEEFMPLHIETAKLAPSDRSLVEALPTQCGDGPPPPVRDTVLERAKAEFAAGRGDDCAEGIEAKLEPESFPIRFHYSTDKGGDERNARLFRFFCGRGAYNEVHVYYLANDIGDLNELHFATPQLDIRYENDDFEGKLESMTVIGFRADEALVNSEYDPESLTLTSWAKWRGVGDASSNGKWIFRDGDFALVRFDVDPTYDGEIEHTTVVDYDTGP